MNDNLKKLEELTARLPNLADAFGPGEVAIHMARERRQAIGLTRWKEKAVVAQSCFMAKGAKLGLYCPDTEIETLIVYGGHLVITIGGKDVHLKSTDLLRITPSDPHTATALKDSWVLVVTIPAAEECP